MKWIKRDKDTKIGENVLIYTSEHESKWKITSNAVFDSIFLGNLILKW